MDPIGLATSIAKLAYQASVALGNLRDLARDSVTLSRLVRRVGMVVQDAASELDAGKLSRTSAVDALRVWITKCAALLNLWLDFPVSLGLVIKVLTCRRKLMNRV